MHSTMVGGMRDGGGGSSPYSNLPSLAHMPNATINGGGMNNIHGYGNNHMSSLSMDSNHYASAHINREDHHHPIHQHNRNLYNHLHGMGSASAVGSWTSPSLAATGRDGGGVNIGGGGGGGSGGGGGGMSHTFGEDNINNNYASGNVGGGGSIKGSTGGGSSGSGGSSGGVGAPFVAKMAAEAFARRMMAARSHGNNN